MKEKLINIIGLGYIGLPTAAILSKNGFKVYGTDLNKDIVDTINKGEIHITEPDLDKLVKESVKSGNLKAFINPQPSDIYIICVPTPLKKEGGLLKPEIGFVESAAESLSSILKDGDMVILESTSPIGTTKFISNHLKNNGVDVENINFAYCPERVLPGSIIKELVRNDRVVGGINSESTKKAADFYRSFVEGSVYETTSETAEMCKLTENSFRDVNIAFANELSIICDKEKIDVNELISLANKHPRVDILEPGPGVGGHCIAVDPWFIASQNPDISKLIQTSRHVNENKKDWVIDQILNKIKDISADTNDNPLCACYGLSYKPNIEDCRESPALEIVERLTKNNKNIIAVDPYISSKDGINLKSIEYAIRNADLHIFLVKHSEFDSLKDSKEFNKDNILDFCRLFN
tara:strand:- start:10337 stop:11557 length:1221 start_codon:yes stop_codon:yes gene_type:complete